MSDLLERGRRGAEGILKLLTPIIQKVPAEHQGLLIALLERNAALRYRAWAKKARSEDERSGLEACATREEELAAKVEALAPDSPGIQESLRDHFSDLRVAYGSVFGGQDRREQMAIQAAAERAGAAFWRGFAANAEPGASATLEECARLEESSAEYLEKLLGG